MFTDMVGYGVLSQPNEALALELLEEHRRVVREILPQHAGREVKTTGDGFLIEFPSALAAVQGAVAMQQALHERNRVQPAERQVRIRIGIHVGDVVLRDGDIHGDGVNIAARLEPLAEPGGICVSNAVSEQVRNKLAHPLTALGPAELKHIELPVVVHRVMLPWLPVGRGPAVANTRNGRHPRPSVRTAAWSAGVVGLALLLAGAVWWGRKHRPADLGTGAVRSVAVGLTSDLPNRDQQAFARVMTELLVSKLSAIKSLAVCQLPTPNDDEDAPQAALEQGRRLQVAFVVRGTVVRESDEVLLIPALVEVASGRVLWSEPHRRRLGDVFGLQADLAEDIARELRAKLTPGDKVLLAKRSTGSSEATQAYVNGRTSWVRGDQAGYSNAIVAFSRAIELAPDLAQAHDAYSVFLAAAGRLDASVEQGSEAVRRNPRAPSYFFDLAYAYMAKGDSSNAWVQARAGWELDRANPMAHLNLGWIHFASRRFVEAEQSFREGLRAQPDDPLNLGGLGASLAAQGRRAEALDVVKRLDELERENLRYVPAGQAA